MFSSNNVLSFGQPITQTQNAMGDGNQQSLNLAYNIPINVGYPTPQVPTLPTPPVFPPMPINQGPVMPQPPVFPPQAFPPPVFQPPVFQPPLIPIMPQQPPQPPIIVQQDNTAISNLVINLINIINQSQGQQQQQQQQQDQSGLGGQSSMLIIFMLMMAKLRKSRGGHDHSEPAPAPAPAPQPAPAPAPPPRVTVKDEALTEKANTIAKKGSPLTLDLNGDGVKTSDQTVNFDINGDGTTDTLNDISQDDAVLTIDTDGDGVSGENGAELLGDNTDLSQFGIQGKFKDGFDALKAIVENAKQRGLINGDDTLDATELATLERVYGLRIKKGGLNAQSTSLADAGVSSLNLATGAKSLKSNFDGRGNDTLVQEGATFTRADGSQGTYEDIFFLYQ